MASRRFLLCLAWTGCVILGAICLLVLSAAQACNKTNQAAPEMALTIIDQSWLDKPSQSLLSEELTQFTLETNIRVQVLPAPEVALEQLDTWRNLLESGAKVPDVYGIDVIWPGILADNLVDLKAYVPEQEIAAQFPELVRNNTVNGRLVACLSTSMKACFFIGSICCTSMDTPCRREHGTNLRRWRSGFRLVSALRGIRIFGAMSGRVRLLRL